MAISCCLTGKIFWDGAWFQYLVFSKIYVFDSKKYEIFRENLIDFKDCSSRVDGDINGNVNEKLGMKVIYQSSN